MTAFSSVVSRAKLCFYRTLGSRCLLNLRWFTDAVAQLPCQALLNAMGRGTERSKAWS